jgi:predicted metal-dependent hydrolase
MPYPIQLHSTQECPSHGHCQERGYLQLARSQIWLLARLNFFQDMLLGRQRMLHQIYILVLSSVALV